MLEFCPDSCARSLTSTYGRAYGTYGSSPAVPPASEDNPDNPGETTAQDQDQGQDQDQVRSQRTPVAPPPALEEAPVSPNGDSFDESDEPAPLAPDDSLEEDAHEHCEVGHCPLLAS